MHRALLNRSTHLAALVAFSLCWPLKSQSLDFDAHAPDSSSLEATEGVIRTRLNKNGCSVGYEDACSIVLQRSEFVSRASHKHGDKVTYRWELMVPDDFTYNAFGGYLRAVRFLNGSGESIFSFILDRESGYTVSRKTCFGPEGFGEWHRVAMQVSWDSTSKKSLKDKTPGELRVICDGVEVLSRSGRPNIGDDETARLTIGLAGSLKLADGDNAEVHFRNVAIESGN
jgi:hypothetical protein